MKGHSQTFAVLLLALLCGCSASPAPALQQRRVRKNQHRSVLSECHVDLSNATFSLLLDCVRDKSLLYLDRMTATESIDLLGQGAVKLVRRNASDGSSPLDALAAAADKTANNSTWAVHVASKLGSLLQTHVLQIDLVSANKAGNTGAAAVEGRGRRRTQMMLPMMLFAIVAIGMVVIPIGFQMLSLFAGKAVLLSKLALMLASLNGLKRLSHSGLSYGFYTAPEPPLVPPLHPRPLWDRSDQPRSN